MQNELESGSYEGANLSTKATPPIKLGFFDNPKKAKGVFAVFLILTIIFLLISGALGYLYWQKDKSLKNSNREKQSQIDQLNKDKTDLEKQLTDVKKENEELKNKNKETDTEKANKEAIVSAYLEVLTYVASLIDKYQGFDNWTEADYQKGLEIAKKTQSSSFLATCQWAWTRKDISQMTRFVRFLNELASGISDTLD